MQEPQDHQDHLDHQDAMAKEVAVSELDHLLIQTRATSDLVDSQDLQAFQDKRAIAVFLEAWVQTERSVQWELPVVPDLKDLLDLAEKPVQEDPKVSSAPLAQRETAAVPVSPVNLVVLEKRDLWELKVFVVSLERPETRDPSVDEDLLETPDHPESPEHLVYQDQMVSMEFQEGLEPPDHQDRLARPELPVLTEPWEPRDTEARPVTTEFRVKPEDPETPEQPDPKEA